MLPDKTYQQENNAAGSSRCCLHYYYDTLSIQTGINYDNQQTAVIS